MRLDSSVTLGYTILWIVIAVLGVPFTTYCCFILDREWNAIYFVKRHRSLVVIELSCCMTVIFLYIVPMSICDVAQVENVYLYFNYIILTPTTSLGELVIVIRLWQLYFDYKLSKLKNEKSWRRAMNPRTMEESENYYVIYRNTLGNSTFLAKFGTIIIVIETVSLCLLRLYGFEDLERFISYTTILLGSSITIGLWCKLKRKGFHYDKLGIGTELILFAIFFVVVACYFVSLAAIYSENIINTYEYDLIWYYSCFIFVMTSSFLTVPLPKLLMISKQNEEKQLKIRYVTRRQASVHAITIRTVSPTPELASSPDQSINTNNNNNLNESFNTNALGVGIRGLSPPPPMITNASSDEENDDDDNDDNEVEQKPKLLSIRSLSKAGNDTNTRTRAKAEAKAGTGQVVMGVTAKTKKIGNSWSDIVVTPFGFESLMNHLAREFSGENLLFITEYVQLKNLLKEEFEDAINELLQNNKSLGYDLQLPHYDVDIQKGDIDDHEFDKKQDNCNDPSNDSKNKHDYNSKRNQKNQKQKRHMAHKNSHNDIPVSLIVQTLKSSLNEINNPIDQRDDNVDIKNGKGKNSSRSKDDSEIYHQIEREHDRDRRGNKTGKTRMRPLTMGIRKQNTKQAQQEQQERGQEEQTHPGGQKIGGRLGNVLRQISVGGRHGGGGKSSTEALGSKSKYDKTIINETSVDIGYLIIDAFYQLYNKYINDYAPYQINISSRKRQILNDMFSPQLYAIRMKKMRKQTSSFSFGGRNKNNNKHRHSTPLQQSRKIVIGQISKMDSIKLLENLGSIEVTRWDKLKYDTSQARKRASEGIKLFTRQAKLSLTNQISNSRSNVRYEDRTSGNEIRDRVADNDNDGENEIENNNNNNNNSSINNINSNVKMKRKPQTVINMIQADFFKHYSEKKNRGAFYTESQLYEWLLLQLLEKMESAVREISQLMNDSFSRFQTDQVVYQKCVELALQLQH